MEQRNVILITIDTIRGDYLSCNGSTRVQTPNLDRLAKQGVNFTRARAPVPLTLPSHASILTGLYPPRHGIHDNGSFKLKETHLTLAEVLRKQGYATAAFVGAFVLDHRFGLNQGFEVYDDHTWSSATMLENVEAERDAETVFRAFKTWFDAYSGSKPFFVWIHFYDPHTPYRPPPPYAARHAGHRYAGEIAYTDSVIGTLLKAFESRKLLEKSVVAVVGDHGEGLGDHQEQTHSVLVYNTTLHVPMILSAPGLIPSGRQVNDLSRTIDLAPTLLDYLGLPRQFGEGTSLRSLIDNKGPGGLEAFSESLVPRLNLGWSELYGLETGVYHYILAPEPELYDVVKDPGEAINLIRQQPELARELQKKVEKFYHGSSVAPAEPMDEETAEKLRSLGYISGAPQPTAKTAKAVDPKQKMDVLNQIQIGLQQFTDGRYREASLTFEKILSGEKDMLLIYDYLGSCYMRLEEWVKAEKCYRTAIGRGLESSVFHMNLGIIHYRRKELDQAKQELEKAIALDNVNVTAYFHLGNACRARGDLQNAVKHFNKALGINPKHVYAKNGLGMTYAAMKRDEEALIQFQEVVTIDPNGIPGYFNLAAQLERVGKDKQALDAYRKFLRLSAGKGFAQERKMADEAVQRLAADTPR